jgi:hypothetical protein
MKKYNYFCSLLMALSLSAHAAVSDVADFQALPMVVVWGADNFAENSPTPNPVASDFLLLTGPSGSVAPDLIAGNVVPFLTGTLTPSSNGTSLVSSLFNVVNPSALPAGGGVLTDNSPGGSLNAGDSMTKFGVNTNTRITVDPVLRRSFYVASNAPFNIYAQSGTPTATGEAVGYENFVLINLTMSMTQSGSDGGLSYGSKAQSPTTGGSGFAAFPVSLNSLSAPTKIYGAGRRTANISGSIVEQSVRFNAQYEVVGAYGLEFGVASLSIPVTYNIYIP